MEVVGADNQRGTAPHGDLASTPSGLEQRKWAALDATMLQEFIQHSFGRNEANTVLRTALR